MHIVADKIGDADYLSARFNKPNSPIWDVIRIYHHQSLLHHFTLVYGSSKNYQLITNFQLWKVNKVLKIAIGLIRIKGPGNVLKKRFLKGNFIWKINCY